MKHGASQQLPWQEASPGTAVLQSKITTQRYNFLLFFDTCNLERKTNKQTTQRHFNPFLAALATQPEKLSTVGSARGNVFGPCLGLAVAPCSLKRNSDFPNLWGGHESLCSRGTSHCTVSHCNLEHAMRIRRASLFEFMPMKAGTVGQATQILLSLLLQHERTIL